jgi:hypothetical protein
MDTKMPPALFSPLPPRGKGTSRPSSPRLKTGASRRQGLVTMGKKKQRPQRPASPYPVMGRDTGASGIASASKDGWGVAIRAADLDITTPFAWCLHCEAVYPTKDWEAAGLACPGPGCDGGAGDMHAWHPEDWPRNAHPEYPAVPVSGGYYPLYDPEPGHKVGELGTWAKDVTPPAEGDHGPG